MKSSSVSAEQRQLLRFLLGQFAARLRAIAGADPLPQLYFLVARGGAGKGYACDLLKIVFGDRDLVGMFSTSEVSRTLAAKDGLLGRAVADELLKAKAGGLFDDIIAVVMCFNEILRQAANKNTRILVDGFLRTPLQAVCLEILALEADITCNTIFLDVPRWICERQAALRYKVEHRPDDEPHLVRKRQRLFDKNTLPGITHLRMLAAAHPHLRFNDIKQTDREMVWRIIEIMNFAAPELAEFRQILFEDQVGPVVDYIRTRTGKGRATEQVPLECPWWYLLRNSLLDMLRL